MARRPQHGKDGGMKPPEKEKPHGRTGESVAEGTRYETCSTDRAPVNPADDDVPADIDPDRDRVGLSEFFRIIKEESNHAGAPSLNGLFTTFLAACSLAGADFTRGLSTRDIGAAVGVSHEIINRRINRLQRRLHIHRQ